MKTTIFSTAFIAAAAYCLMATAQIPQGRDTGMQRNRNMNHQNRHRGDTSNHRTNPGWNNMDSNHVYPNDSIPGRNRKMR